MSAQGRPKREYRSAQHEGSSARLAVSRYVTIGGLHVLGGQLCEDYAIAQLPQRDVAIVAVADGCSGAHADTDIGARVVCQAFSHVAVDHEATRQGRLRDDFDAMLESTILQFAFTQDLADYLATLVGVVATSQRATAFICGDGAIGVRFRDGRFELRTFAWRDDTPYYFVYRLEPGVRERMLQKVSADCPGAVSSNVFEFTIDEKGGAQVASRRSEAFTFDEFEHGRRFEFAPERQDIAAIAVFTDGVEKVGELGACDVVARLLAPRGEDTATLAERATGVMRALAVEGHMAFDDLAFACVEFIDDEPDLD